MTEMRVSHVEQALKPQNYDSLVAAVDSSQDLTKRHTISRKAP